MDFRKHFKSVRPFEINLVPFISIMFLLLLFSTLSSYMTQPASIHVRLPKAVTSDVVNDKNLVVVVTSENILYLDNKVVTLDELKALLFREKNNQRPVLIKADRRASVGRIVDVWNLGRTLGIEKINVATDQEQ